MTREEAKINKNNYHYLCIKLSHEDAKQVDIFIYKIYDDFESHTCRNCKWYQKRKGWNIYSCENPRVVMWIESEIPYFSPQSDFGCNKFVRKNGS